MATPQCKPESFLLFAFTLALITQQHPSHTLMVWKSIFALQHFHSYLVLSTIALCTQHFGALSLSSIPYVVRLTLSMSILQMELLTSPQHTYFLAFLFPQKNSLQLFSFMF